MAGRGGWGERGIRSPEFFLKSARPTCVIGEVPRHKGNVDVPRLPDRLSVVQALDNREQPGVLLDVASDRVEVTPTFVARQSRPSRLCRSRRLHSRVHFGYRTIRHASDRVSIAWGEDLEVPAAGNPRSPDEMPERAVMLVEPLMGERRRFRCRTVRQGVIKLANAHKAIVAAIRYGHGVHDDDLREEIAAVLGDETELRLWATMLIRYAENTFSTAEEMVRLLSKYPEDRVRRAWRIANKIPDDDTGAGSLSRLNPPRGPLRGEDAR